MQATQFQSVYGPVQSWRFGRSLGIDPIGTISRCSFDCVYCQLGEIEDKTSDRQCFVPTETIRQDLQTYAPWDDVDYITVSGSGEPTLALNLGEILTLAKTMTHKPTAVLTNGSLLDDPQVRADLAIADAVAVKVDAIRPETWERVNRPTDTIQWSTQWSSLLKFRQDYPGRLLIQTMLLFPWSEAEQVYYIEHMQQLHPDEIQLNTPTRPKGMGHHLEARANHPLAETPYPARSLKPVTREALEEFRNHVWHATHIPVRIPDVDALTSTP